MAPSGTEPGVEAGHLRILHLTKVPPSDSGIAAFARAFSKALRGLGEVTELGLPLDAAATQRPSEIARTAARARRAWASVRPDLVVTQLSGRALAEYYSCLGLSWLGRSAAHWVVLHDPPSLVGPSLLVSTLDRKGGRRAGVAASSTVGEPLERALLRRVDAVIVFSTLGAQLLADRHPEVDPVVVDLPAEVVQVPKQRVVYVPSYATASSVEPVLEAMALGPAEPILHVGHLSPSDEDAVVRAAHRLSLEHRLRLLGRLDDTAYRESFDRAEMVVRHRHQAGGNAGAISGPITYAMAAGCAVVTTDARGSAGCLTDGAGIDLSDRADDLIPTVAALLGDPEQVKTLGERARTHVVEHHAPEVVAGQLRDLWELGGRAK